MQCASHSLCSVYLHGLHNCVALYKINDVTTIKLIDQTLFLQLLSMQITGATIFMTCPWVKSRNKKKTFHMCEVWFAPRTFQKSYTILSVLSDLFVQYLHKTYCSRAIRRWIKEFLGNSPTAMSNWHCQSILFFYYYFWILADSNNRRIYLFNLLSLDWLKIM